MKRKIVNFVFLVLLCNNFNCIFSASESTVLTKKDAFLKEYLEKKQELEKYHQSLVAQAKETIVSRVSQFTLNLPFPKINEAVTDQELKEEKIKFMQTWNDEKERLDEYQRALIRAAGGYRNGNNFLRREPLPLTIQPLVSPLNKWKFPILVVFASVITYGCMKFWS